MRHSTILTGLGILGVLPLCAQDQAGERPNILVILVDDMGYSDIGCFGSEIQTPNIDRICREGMMFTQCYNAGRSCPSRASLLTGMYHHKTGVGAMVKPVGDLPNYQGFLNRQCMTIAEVLKTAGYKTYMSGKWHLGDQDGNWPCDRGFDESFVFLGGAGSYFYPNERQRDGGSVMAVNDEYYYPPKKGYYHTDAFSENAARFIEEHDYRDRFFMYLAYTATHWPLQAYDEDIRKYDGVYDSGWDEMRKRRYERMVASGLIDSRWALSPRDETVPAWDTLSAEEQAYWADIMEIYAAVIDRMDQGVGRVLQALERKGELDNTVILFLSDNGGCMEEAHKFADLSKYTGKMGSGESFLAYEAKWANVSDTPFRYFKHWMHEGGISTPLLVRYPKAIDHGSRSDVPVHIIDILPTCMSFSGATYPSDRNANLKPLDGVSLCPVFANPDQPVHDYLFFEHLGFRGLRQGDYKIVSTYPENKWELYNIREDRTELHDLSSEMPERVEAMSRLYEQTARKSEVMDWKEVAKIKNQQRKQRMSNE